MVFPKTGHTINLEEPALFNFALQDFFTQVDSGRWLMRDKRTETGGRSTGWQRLIPRKDRAAVKTARARH